MGNYVFLSYTTTIITLLFIVYIYIRERFLIVKPSIWFVGFYHLTIQWASSIYSDFSYKELAEPYIFYTLTQLIPLSIVLISRFTFRHSAFIVWKRIESRPSNHALDEKYYKRLLKITLSISAFVLMIYFQYVPFTETGLYVSFTETNLALVSLARENSSKLITQQWLKYCEVFFEKFLAPFSSSILTILIIFKIKEKRRLYALPLGLLILVLMITAAMPAARINGALVLLAAMITFILSQNKKIKLFKIVLLATGVLLPAIIIEMNKYTNIQGSELFFIAAEEVFIRRIFYVPIEAGVQWIQYIEKFGFWGIAGFEKIALLAGVAPLHVPNILGNYYWSIDYYTTGYLNVGFTFSYYCYFGKFAIPLMVIGVLLLDTWVIFYKSLKRYLLLPAIVSLNMACIALTESDFFTIFITYGFATGLIFLLWMNKILKIKNA
jgi:hypothetical protein